MLLAQLLLRALCLGRGPRLFQVVLLAVVLAAVLGVASAAGAHSLHAALSAGAHLIADDNTWSSGGGPPHP